MFSDCLSHQKKQCFKCNFEESCDGLGLLTHTGDKPKGSLKPPYCDVMEISEYERLVAKETKTLQLKVTAVIDDAIKTMGTKQTELLDNIKRDPRKSEMETIEMKLVLQTSKKTQNSEHQRINLVIQANKELASKLKDKLDLVDEFLQKASSVIENETVPSNPDELESAIQEHDALLNEFNQLQVKVRSEFL